MGSATETPQFEIPTHCKAGVVVNEGPNFHLEVQMVPVPEPGIFAEYLSVVEMRSLNYSYRAG